MGYFHIPHVKYNQKFWTFNTKQTQEDAERWRAVDMVMSSLGFLFVAYILYLELKEPATWRQKQAQTNKAP